MVSYEHLPAKLRERAGDVAEGLIENAEATAEMLLEAWHCRRFRVRMERARESIRTTVRRSSLIEHERRVQLLNTWASIEDACDAQVTAEDTPPSPSGRLLRGLAELERHRHLPFQRRPLFGSDIENAAGPALDELAQDTTDRRMQSLRAIRVSNALRPVLGMPATLVIHDVYPPAEGGHR